MLSLLFLKILAVRLGPSCCVKGSLQRSSGHHRNRTVGWNGQHLDMTSLGEIQANFFVLRRIDGKCCTKKKQNDYPSNSPKLGSKNPSNIRQFSQSSTFFQNPLNIFRYRRFLRVPSGSLELRVTPLGAGMLLPDTKLSLRTRGLGTWWLSFGRVKDMWHLVGNDL